MVKKAVFLAQKKREKKRVVEFRSYLRILVEDFGIGIREIDRWMESDPRNRDRSRQFVEDFWREVQDG